jgi:hypothetical protein
VRGYEDRGSLESVDENQRKMESQRLSDEQGNRKRKYIPISFRNVVVLGSLGESYFSRYPARAANCGNARPWVGF